MLVWLGPEPERVLRDQIEAMLHQQLHGTKLVWIRIVEAPRTSTLGARRAQESGIDVHAMGVAFAFSLMARSADGVDRDVHGVASMLGTELHRGPSRRKFRFFFEIDGDLGKLGSSEVLGARLMALREIG